MILLRCRRPRRCSSLPFLLHTHSFCASSLPVHHLQYKELNDCNLRIQELGRLGKVDQARELFDQTLHRDSFTWNSMINGYAQVGQIDAARSLFDSFSGKNIRTWTSIVSGYAKNGRIEEARKLFDVMPERNVVSWNAMISGYVQNNDLVSAKCLFDEMPERNVASWNTLITGYIRNGQIEEAHQLFLQMRNRNLATWMLMISGYVQVDDFQKGWDLFVRMHYKGVLPDQSVFVVVLSALSGLCDPTLLDVLRPLGMKTSYEKDVVVGTTILNIYTKIGKLSTAFKFYEGMPARNEFSWTTMIAAFSQSGRLEDALAVYERIPEHNVDSKTAMLAAYAHNGRIRQARQLFNEIENPNVVTWNSMVAGYAQNGMLDEARDMFSRMPVRNSASWAAMISAFAQQGQNVEALKLLSELHRSGMHPTDSSFTSALFACASIGALDTGRQLHTLTVKTGYQFNSYVGIGLTSMYAKCRNLGTQSYMLDDALSIFKKMPKRDVVSWTALISAYAQAGHRDMALELFFDMLASGVKPNSSTMTSLLVTSGNLGGTKFGRQMHDLIFKLGLDTDVFVCNSLISMYLKCGCEDGFLVFEEMNERDIVTWNAILIGCAQNGFGKEAVEIFEQMKAVGVLPNQISFVGILCACSHVGLVDKGLDYFNSMKVDYGLVPSEEHYACMVDLLGRAGHLYEAEALIKSMPIEPDSVVWSALLGACRIHKNVALGRRVAEILFQLEPYKPGNYVLLSEIYASLGMWKEMQEVRKLMKLRGVTKQPGMSWIQTKDNHLTPVAFHGGLNQACCP